MPSASGSPPLASLGGTLLDGRFYLQYVTVWRLVLFGGSTVVSFVVRTMMAAKSSIVHLPINMLLFLVTRVSSRSFFHLREARLEISRCRLANLQKRDQLFTWQSKGATNTSTGRWSANCYYVLHWDP